MNHERDVAAQRPQMHGALGWRASPPEPALRPRRRPTCYKVAGKDERFIGFDRLLNRLNLGLEANLDLPRGVLNRQNARRGITVSSLGPPLYVAMFFNVPPTMTPPMVAVLRLFPPLRAPQSLGEASAGAGRQAPECVYSAGMPRQEEPEHSPLTRQSEPVSYSICASIKHSLGSEAVPPSSVPISKSWN